MYTMVNDQKQEFDQLSELEKFGLSIKSPMQSNIEDMEYNLSTVGMRIIESTTTADQDDGYKELIQEQ